MSKSQPLVSFIISVYNDEKRVSAALQSIVLQSYKNLEIRIVDDASTDNTLPIIQSFAKEYKNIYVYKNSENIGLTKSLNLLAPKTKGEYIARQDSDDISNPLRTEKQINAIFKYNLDFCTTRAVINNTNKTIPGKSFYIPKKLLIKYKNPFIHGSLLINKKVFKEIGLYDERFYFSQDYKLMIDLINKGYKFKIINEILYTLNFSDNISLNFKDQQNYYANCARNGINPKLKV